MDGKKQKDWFKLKRYPHIGFPLNPNDRYKWIEGYITSPEKIAQHAFLPFIHRTSKVKKFRKVYSEIDGKLDDEFKDGFKVLRNADEKKRELFYASHLDSLVFSYYASQLSGKYEEILKSESFQLNEEVNAYRSIPINPDAKKTSNKCNINFADDIFNIIRNYDKDEFNVIAFDITSFFDNLDHKLLREVWCKVLGCNRLPNDHFNVYKNITRFSHVDIVDIFEEFKDRIYTRKINKFGKPLEIKRKPIDKVKFLKNKNAIAFCSKPEFFMVKHKLLQPSKTAKLDDGTIVKRNFGIPQGSPISSILANMYLLEFDKTIRDFIKPYGGTYRRYSDDMIVVCPKEVKDQLCDLVYSKIKDYKLKIQPHKTQEFIFKNDGGTLICGQKFNDTVNWHKNLTYLGFEFDGVHTYLKSGSLSRFYRNMKRAVRRSKHFSGYKKIDTSGEIFKHRLFKKYSYKGARRRRKYLWDNKKNLFYKSDIYYWGNFLTYALKAARVMENNKIKGQTRKHWKILNDLISEK